MYVQTFSIIDIGLRHTKESTSGNFLAQVGVCSGLIHLLYFIVLMVMRPISRHSFIMRALKRFYLARTGSAEVFKKYQQKKYNKSKLLFGEDMPDDDFDEFD